MKAMAKYKYATNLEKSDHTAFDEELTPGETCPNSGIYRCTGCGDEIASNKGNPMPPQNHHQHSNGSKIRWKLLVFAVQQ
jgi:hypothetical protein